MKIKWKKYDFAKKLKPRSEGLYLVTQERHDIPNIRRVAIRSFSCHGFGERPDDNGKIFQWKIIAFANKNELWDNVVPYTDDLSK